MILKRYKRIVLNLSGDIFETFERTLKRYPETLLGDVNKRQRYFNLTSGEYFFDRSRLCFGAILYFYQSNGILSCPPDISVDVFVAECKFFEIPDAAIERMAIKEGMIPKFRNPHDMNQSRTFRARVWDISENPETSTAARLYAIFSLTVIWLSILSACLETVPSLKGKSEKLEENPWALLELVLNSWFLIELLTRFISSPSTKTFAQSSLNWIDVVAVIPYFIIFIFTPNEVSSLGFLRILRFVRVFRLFRLSKHSRKLYVIGEIIKSSLADFQLFLICLYMLVTLGGSFMYYVEGYNSSSTGFTSIPNSLWWAIQTITTLGYGDIVPVTIVGRCLAASFMALGVLTITLPVLSIVIKFMAMYSKNIEGDRLII